MAYAIAGISGNHINTAITRTVSIPKKIFDQDTNFYNMAQCIETFWHAGLMWAIASGIPGYSLNTTEPGQYRNSILSPTDYSLAACLADGASLTAQF